jgi:hypothetical protein
MCDPATRGVGAKNSFGRYEIFELRFAAEHITTSCARDQLFPARRAKIFDTRAPPVARAGERAL